MTRLAPDQAVPGTRPLAVIAIGGNSLIKESRHPEVHHQWDAVRETARHIANMVQTGWRAVVTHGNGPQVGYILRRNELALDQVHATPLDVIVADTQGSIGYMLQQALNNEFFQRRLQLQCVTLLTQVRVDPEDAAFARPSKPIGGFLDQAAAQQFADQGWHVVEDAGRGWRRVVASPTPQEIVELDAIAQAVAAGWIVIAAGGGGIPVVRNAKGELRGTAAVIDKDWVSSLLAIRVQADLLLISTSVERVALHFGTPQQHDLAELTVADARRYLAEGHFAPGSMLPKIEACIRFLETRAKTRANANLNATPAAIITNPPNLERALRGETGTRIIMQS